MNKKGMELAISTLIIIILGVLVMVGIIYAVTKAFKASNETTETVQPTQSSAIKQACSLACQSEDKLTYCCHNYTLNDEQIKCTDARVDAPCANICDGYNCN